uniref:EGF-like domain-containing protein n=1 Tax=Caenorhabditis japonica TaxID=281687 RepID=A0A8R1EBA8_CAEJA
MVPRVPSSLCPSSCSGQGFCAFLADVYRCVCDSGYSGDGCESSPTASSLWSIGLIVLALTISLLLIGGLVFTGLFFYNRFVSKFFVSTRSIDEPTASPFRRSCFFRK